MTCFQSANSLQQFGNKFWTLSHVHNSAIFNATWSKTMEDVYHRDMTVSDVGPKVWKPAFKQCQQLLEKLNSGSMTLSDVDKHFSQYKGELQRLERELKSLFCGVNACGRKDRDPSWIYQAVTQMEEYWRLCEYCETANSFLKLRDSLELTKGDFKKVENISKKVNKHACVIYVLGNIMCSYCIPCIFSAILYCRCPLP